MNIRVTDNSGFEEAARVALLPDDNPNRFENLLHDLREIFCFLETAIPRPQLLPPTTRAKILGAHTERNSIEVYLEGVMKRSTGKLEAHSGWKDILKASYTDLLIGLSTYSQIYPNSLLGTNIGRKISDQVAAFCRELGVGEFKPIPQNGAALTDAEALMLGAPRPAS